MLSQFSNLVFPHFPHIYIIFPFQKISKFFQILTLKFRNWAIFLYFCVCTRPWHLPVSFFTNQVKFSLFTKITMGWISSDIYLVVKANILSFAYFQAIFGNLWLEEKDIWLNQEDWVQIPFPFHSNFLCSQNHNGLIFLRNLPSC